MGLLSVCQKKMLCIFFENGDRAEFGPQSTFSVGRALRGLALKAPLCGALRRYTPSKK